MTPVSIPPHAPADCGDCCSQWLEKFVSQEPAPDDTIATIDHDLSEAREKVALLERVRTEKVWLQEVRRIAAKAWMEATRMLTDRQEAERKAQQPVEQAQQAVLAAGLRYLQLAEAQAAGAQVDPLGVHETQSTLIQALRSYRRVARP